jgi:hypothetical protein
VEQMKGQFMLVSAVVAGLIVISLSNSIMEIQNQEFKAKDLPEHINQLRDEAERITRDGSITDKEKRNFRKMTGYIESYRVSSEFDDSVPCVRVTIRSTDKLVETPCMR